MDRLQAMQVFTRVAEQGSFSAAADQLHMSKSAVSKSIAGLEDHLGARLLNRTTRKLSLTEAGSLYLEACARIIAEVEEAENSTQRLQSNPRGKLRVNAPMSFGVSHVAPLIVPFMAAFPDIEVDLTLNDRFVDLVDEGFDLAIRIGSLDDSTLIARKLGEDEILLVAAPNYLERRGVPAAPADLSDHDCLVYTYGRTRDEWRFRSENGLAPVRVQGRFRANNGDAVRVAAVGGLGVALLPQFIIRDDLVTGRLVRLLPEISAAPLEIHAIYPHNRHQSAKLRTFIDYLREHLMLAGNHR